MDPGALTAISPLDGRYREKTAPLREIFSEQGLIKFRVEVEIHWLELLANSGKLNEIPPLSNAAKSFLQQLIDHFSQQDVLVIKNFEVSIKHDVKAVEYFLKEKFTSHPELNKLSELIHFGCTSEDINNLAYGIMLRTTKENILLPILNQLLKLLTQCARDFASIPMLSRTHGQPATPTTLGKEFANVAARLKRQIAQLAEIPILGKMNGASGNYNALVIAYPHIPWQELSQQLISNLGLIWNPYTTQIEPHDSLSEFFSILIRINTILLDFDRDIWGYIALNYLKLKAISDEIGSSTMPHKINPIDFENSEGNLGVANALLNHMILKLPVSRWQRDLSDSTVLRNIGVALGHSLLAYQATLSGVEKIAPNEVVIREDLNQHWEVLAEAIQTVMRKFNLPQPYETLKTFTRGKPIDQTILHSFIKELALPEDVKKQLLQLTPERYLGYAEELAKKIS